MVTRRNFVLDSDDGIWLDKVMEATTTSETTFRAVIVHEDGKFGYTYNVVRETADEAFADRDRLANEDLTLFSPDGHKVEVVVVKTTTTTTTTEVTR